MQLTERMRDIILAGAIGDSVGYLVEFNRYDAIKRIYGEPITTDNIGKGKIPISDDTQMTLFLLEYMSKVDVISEEGIRGAFNAWLKTQSGEIDTSYTLTTFDDMRHARAPGTTCLSALGRGKGIDSKGCGAVMRTAPCAFINHSDIVEFSVLQSKITHTNTSAVLPAQILTELLWMLINYGDHSIDYTINNVLMKTYYDSTEETVSVLKYAISLAKSYDPNIMTYDDIVQNIHKIGGGWTGHEALAIAVYCVLISKTERDVLKYSINHDGDSDSTGSIAMQIWAAKHGLSKEFRNFAQDRINEIDVIQYVLGLNYCNLTIQ